MGHFQSLVYADRDHVATLVDHPRYRKWQSAERLRLSKFSFEDHPTRIPDLHNSSHSHYFQVSL